MTPEEIAANSDDLQQVFLADGRQRVWPRFQEAYNRATELGQAPRAAAIEARVERDAMTHARREMARLGIRGAAGDRIAPQAQPQATMPTLTGVENRPARNATEQMLDTTNVGLDWSDPATFTRLGRQPTIVRSASPAVADAVSRWGQEQGGIAGDAALAAARGMSNVADFAGNVSGYFGGQRAANALMEGDYGTAATEAASAAAPYVAGPVVGGANRLLGAAGMSAGAPRAIASGLAGGLILETAAGRGPLFPSPAEAQPRNRAQPQGNPSVMRLQEQLRDAGYYNGPIDGILSPDSPTMKAKAAFDAAEKAKTDAANAAAATAAQVKASEAAAAESAAKLAETTRLKEEADRAAERRAAGEQRLKEIDNSLTSQVLKGAMTVGPWVGYGVGGYLGHRMQGALGERAAAAAATRAANADSVMAQSVANNDIPGRVGRINQFWSEGNSGRVEPFRAAPRSNRGYVPNTEAPPAADLYQPSRAGRVFEAVPVPVVGGVEHVATEFGIAAPARQELAAAEDAVRSDPSEGNIQRLQLARARMAGSDLASRLGLGIGIGSFADTALGAVGGAPRARPDVAAAERERGRINALLAGRPTPTGGGGGGSSPRNPSASGGGPYRDPATGRFAVRPD